MESLKNSKISIATAALVSVPVFLAGHFTAPQEYVTDIVTEQASKEQYVQVLEGNKLPDDAKGTLSRKLPDNVSVNTVSGPEGNGYSIVTKTADKTVSIGIGAYAEDHTWVKDNAPLSATSTKN